MAELEHPAHSGAAKVKVAVFQPHHLFDLGLLVDGERRRLGGVQDFERMHFHLDLAGGQIWIFHALRPSADDPLDAHHPLGPHLLCGAMGGRRYFGIGHDLHDTRAVAQIQEGDATVIPPAIDPGRQNHGFSHMVRAQFAASMASKHRASLLTNDTPPDPAEFGRRKVLPIRHSQYESPPRPMDARILILGRDIHAHFHRRSSRQHAQIIASGGKRGQR